MLHTLSSLTVYMQNQNTVYSIYPIGKSKFKKSTYWALDGKKKHNTELLWNNQTNLYLKKKTDERREFHSL